ncbi:hypothetical protein VCRA2128O99_300030 [Vibrio crassostreae]|nr:hypothetical protein VCRA2128O103_270029 [Vibrio crassostreae]CAK3439010.1 hypothetical protein VCRA2128O104_280029 [Vibrio crassostreae]CAK3944374.1 hypothetical protein VCRA2128O99_300030 [Vibrio crassostreae]
MPAIPPPLDIKLMVKRSQYKHAKTERQKKLIAQQAKILKRKANQHA